MGKAAVDRGDPFIAMDACECSHSTRGIGRADQDIYIGVGAIDRLSLFRSWVGRRYSEHLHGIHFSRGDIAGGFSVRFT